MSKIHQIIAAAGAAVLAAGPATASTTFFTDFSNWQAATGSFETFETTASNVALANEVTSTPTYNTQLGQTLTFDSSNTGLDTSFTLQHIEQGSSFGFSFVSRGCLWRFSVVAVSVF